MEYNGHWRQKHNLIQRYGKFGFFFQVGVFAFLFFSIPLLLLQLTNQIKQTNSILSKILLEWLTSEVSMSKNVINMTYLKITVVPYNQKAPRHSLK